MRSSFPAVRARSERNRPGSVDLNVDLACSRREPGGRRSSAGCAASPAHDFPWGKGWLAVLTALVCVIAALVVAVAALALWVMRLSARERQTARAVEDQFLSLKAVRSWAEEQLSSLRSELNVARVDASAAAVGARREKRSAAPPAPAPDHGAPKVRDEHPAPAERAPIEPPAPRDEGIPEEAAAPQLSTEKQPRRDTPASRQVR
jgi:hypothetical protein